MTTVLFKDQFVSAPARLVAQARLSWRAPMVSFGVLEHRDTYLRHVFICHCILQRRRLVMSTKSGPRVDVGCLVFVAIVIGALAGLLYTIRYQALENSETRQAVIGTIRQLSHTSDSDEFFRKMTESWKDIRDIGGIWSFRPPAVKKLPSGKFALLIESGINTSTERGDLGLNARSDSIRFIALLLKLSEGKLNSIETMTVHLHATDGARSVDYIVEFHPGTALTKSIDQYSDSDLNSVIDRNLIKLVDSASGAHWVPCQSVSRSWNPGSACVYPPYRP
jgi:hypothetical protein